MIIKRRGSSRNMGVGQITLDGLSFSLRDDGSVSISCLSVKDFNKEAHHDYEVSITPEEVRKITSFALRSAKISGGKNV